MNGNLNPSKAGLISREGRKFDALVFCVFTDHFPIHFGTAE